jgi:peptidoglycan/LPS O-acetylase OafA/YrhL
MVKGRFHEANGPITGDRGARDGPSPGVDGALGMARRRTFAMATGKIETSGSRRNRAVVLSLLTLSLYALFMHSDLGPRLFDWSKTFADYDVRRNLGMSKRYLWQYGHMLFLFLLLVLSRYVFLSDEIASAYRSCVDKVMLHTFPIFILHFPLLFFLAAVTDYDRASNWQQLALLLSVFILCILFGKICRVFKPRYDAGLKRVLAYIDARWPTAGETASAGRSKAHYDTPLDITTAHSYALNVVKIVALFSVVLGHFSFREFTSWHIPGFNGHAPRFAVPAFFMMSGYFAMLSMDRSRGSALSAIVKRYWSYYYLIVPMLLIVPIMDNIGYAYDAAVYRYDEYYVFERERGPYGLLHIVSSYVNCLLFLNEIWIYDLVGYEREFGGPRCFSNDPYWFLSYLMPYVALLAVTCRVPGRAKYAILAAMITVIGPPILLLSPVFFAGALAYLIHKRY